MLKVRILVAAAAFVALAAAPDSARAQNEAYCAYAGGHDTYENCGYYTLRQCMEAVSGVGGSCRPNPSHGGYASPSSRSYDEPPPRRRVVRPQ